MRSFNAYLGFCLCFLLGCAQSKPEFVPQQGDLLLQNLNCGALCDAIEKVTTGYDKKSFSHIGVVLKTDSGMAVLEAYDGVSVVSLATFLERTKLPNGKTAVLAARLKPAFLHLIPTAIVAGKQLIGKKYDSEFDLKNDEYYCSELIYTIFKEANGNQDFFPLNKMTFFHKTDTSVAGTWRRYFEQLKIPVPENELGINPGAISRSPNIEMVHDYNP